MRERKFIKLNVNMYEDTKSKIIDMKPERDLIHYLWTRFVILAGKVNLEGDLFMSKTIPYTIETLAIEFNRDANQIKLALDVFVELEMIEITEHNVYRVKNFAKHQNIKVKETIKAEENEEAINVKEVQVEEDFENEVSDNAEIYNNKDEESKNKIVEDKIENVKDNEAYDLEVGDSVVEKNKKKDINENENKNIGKIKEIHTKIIGETGYDEKIDNNLQDNQTNIIPIVLEEKKKKQQSKKQNKKKKNTIDFDEIDEGDNSIIQIFEGDGVRPLLEGERVVGAWSF